MDDDANRFWKRRNPFYDLFSEFDRMDEMMESMMKKAFDDMDKLKTSGKPVSYGFSMKIGPDGDPVIQEFGNMRPTEKNIEVRDEREPLVDVISHPTELDILAELPGVEKTSIDVNSTSDRVVINVPGKFRKEIQLKERVLPETLKSHYKNGVLTITIKKKDAKESKVKQ